MRVRVHVLRPCLRYRQCRAEVAAGANIRHTLSTPSKGDRFCVRDQRDLWQIGLAKLLPTRLKLMPICQLNSHAVPVLASEQSGLTAGMNHEQF